MQHLKTWILLTILTCSAIVLRSSKETGFIPTGRIAKYSACSPVLTLHAVYNHYHRCVRTSVLLLCSHLQLLPPLAPPTCMVVSIHPLQINVHNLISASAGSPQAAWSVLKTDCEINLETRVWYQGLYVLPVFLITCQLFLMLNFCVSLGIIPLHLFSYSLSIIWW